MPHDVKFPFEIKTILSPLFYTVEKCRVDEKRPPFLYVTVFRHSVQASQLSGKTELIRAVYNIASQKFSVPSIGPQSHPYNIASEIHQKSLLSVFSMLFLWMQLI